MSRMLMSLALVLLSFSFQAFAGEEELPLWELGVGVGASTLPQYIGSDERYAIPFAFPYVVYRGEHWRVDPSGVRNRLFDVESLSLDISLSGGLPVMNENRAREGMPELKLTGEIGPKLNWYIHESKHDSWSLHLPVRAGVNIDVDYIGWVSDPHINYSFHKPLHGGVYRAGFDIGVQYNSSLYNETYYDVEPAYKTASRSVYQADGGFHSTYIKARVRYPIEKGFDVFATLQARTLQGGGVVNSPLVKNKLYTTFTLVGIWVISTSDEVVISDE